MVHLIIITPVTRHVNVPAIYHSIENASKTSLSVPVQITWFPVFAKGCMGHGEDWQVRFSRNPNENILINCKISSSDNVNIIRNEILDELEDTCDYYGEGDAFVTFIDDNNILYDNLIISLQMSEQVNEKWDGYIYNRKPHGDIPISDIDKNVSCKQLTAAQICVKLKLLTGMRFAEYTENADGLFIEHIYKKFKDKIDINESVMCYHNYLS